MVSLEKKKYQSSVDYSQLKQFSVLPINKKNKLVVSLKPGAIDKSTMCIMVIYLILKPIFAKKDGRIWILKKLELS